MWTQNDRWPDSRPRRWALFGATAAALLATGAAWAAALHEPFLGEYVGDAISDNAEEISKRDISVTIEASEGGFSVRWTAVIRRASGRLKRSDLKINFQPTGRGNLYRSAMRTNMFGQAAPLDPMQGDPYVWARISGRTLSVYALIITDEGGYEMQGHERTLTDEGMLLEYERVRDGEILRNVTGKLRRTH
jgi:hypothetical protein